MYSPDAFKGTRVLVTGSAGVIGRELLDLLFHAGARILSIDREPLVDELGSAVTHHQRDLGESDTSDIRAFDPEIVFHLAASFERTVESPDFWPVNWNDNTLASHHVIEAAAAAPSLRRFVFASSYLIYDSMQYVAPELPAAPRALAETDRVSTRNLCGAAKYYTEQELRFMSEVARPGLTTVSARIYRVYGRGSRDVVSRWIRAALQGEPIEVFNPENRFDYIYSRDVAEGLLRIAQSAAQGPINLGSGQSRGIHEVLAAIRTHVPDLPDRTRLLGSPGPFEASCAELGRLRQQTSWAPPTSLEEGVARVVAFERQRLPVATGAR